MHTLHNGDALEWMKSLPAASVDCVFVDLPYFGVVADDWEGRFLVVKLTQSIFP